jgi:two-component system, NarL family, sensor kinase
MSQEKIGTLVIIFCFIIILGFVFFIVYIVSLHQKSRNKFLLEMEELKNNFRNEILQSELEMQEQTFETISMEIHDNVSQLLSVSKLNLGMIEEATPEVLEKIRYSVDLMTHAMKDLRDLSRRLDSDMIRQEGLCMAIEAYISQLRKSVTGEIVFNARGYGGTITVEKELILFRILQEAINNILKHAEASLIVIDLIFSYGELQLIVTDNGRGFDFSYNSGRIHVGSGIKNMQKRSALIEGKFFLESAIGKGTRIEVHIPVIFLGENESH